MQQQRRRLTQQTHLVITKSSLMAIFSPGTNELVEADNCLVKTFLYFWGKNLFKYIFLTSYFLKITVKKKSFEIKSLWLVGFFSSWSSLVFFFFFTLTTNIRVKYFTIIFINHFRNVFMQQHTTGLILDTSVKLF